MTSYWRQSSVYCNLLLNSPKLLEMWICEYSSLVSWGQLWLWIKVSYKQISTNILLVRFSRLLSQGFCCSIIINDNSIQVYWICFTDHIMFNLLIFMLDYFSYCKFRIPMTQYIFPCIFLRASIFKISGLTIFRFLKYLVKTDLAKEIH